MCAGMQASNPRAISGALCINNERPSTRDLDQSLSRVIHAANFCLYNEKDVNNSADGSSRRGGGPGHASPSLPFPHPVLLRRRAATSACMMRNASLLMQRLGLSPHSQKVVDSVTAYIAIN